VSNSGIFVFFPAEKSQLKNSISIKGAIVNRTCRSTSGGLLDISSTVILREEWTGGSPS